MLEIELEWSRSLYIYMKKHEFHTKEISVIYMKHSIYIIQIVTVTLLLKLFS